MPQDKANHAFYGLLTYIVVGMVNPHLAICVVFVQSLGKEVYDYYNPKTNTADFMDFVYTFAPSMVLYALEYGIIVTKV